MFQALRNKTKRIATTLAAGVLLFSQFVAPASAFADQNTPPPNLNDWPYWCSQYDGGVKFDTGAVGTHSKNVAGGSINITIVDPDKTEVSDVTGTGVEITKVVIKGGSTGGNGGEGNQYYVPPFNYNLEAPLNNGGQQADISHVIVCYDDKTTVEVIKKLLPANDNGKFNLGIDVVGQAQGDTVVTNVGNDGTTGKAVVRSDRDVVISEAAYAGSDLDNYTSTVACVYQNGDPVDVSNIDVDGDNRDAKITASKIDPGDDIVCTFTNTRKTGDLKVIKNVINDNGGTKTYADFTFKVDGGDTPRSFNQFGDPEDGAKVVALPGGTSFNVTEVQANSDGYVTTYSAGCTGTIVEGQTKVCTITNSDQAAQLRVIKNVTNNSGGNAQANAFTLYVNGQAKTQNQYFNANPGSYTVTESGPDGYEQTGLTCVNDANGYAVAHPVNLTLGKSITCTVYNDDKGALLTVYKHVINDNGGTKVAPNFTMYVNGTDVSDDEFPGDEYGTTVSLDAGSYSVSESVLSSYLASYSGDCEGIIGLGEHKYCTITNDDKAPVLTLLKQVLNLNGGSAEADDWLLKATGPTTISGWGGVISGSTFSAGTYSLSEHYGPSGYVASDWTCIGGEQDGSTIKVGLGEVASCAIVNSDKPAKIKVTKEVVNNNGGEAEVSDFDLWVDGTQVVSGVNNNFAGNEWYTISETQIDGYKKTFLKCWDVTGQYPVFVGSPFYAKLGHSYSCKIINDDIAPKLTIIKDSHPNSIQVFNFTIEGDDFDKNFQLNDNGTSFPVDNDKTFYLDKGEYTVTEAATDGWYLDSIYCWGTREDVDLENGSVSVDLKLGDEVICKFVNKKFGQIKGFKYEDVNKNGHWDEDESKLSGWTITLDKLNSEDEQVSTVTDQNGRYKFEGLKPGLYKVCEVQQDGWVQTAPDTDDGCEKNWIFPGDTDFVKFGNFELGTVTGVKFNDLNGNGVRDQNEPTLKDWTITLTKKCAPNEEVSRLLDIQTDEHQEECEDVTESTKTDVNGVYSFGDLDLGTYIVCEVQQANWTQTAPKTKDGCVEFTVEASGHDETVDFGNKAKPQVLGETTTAELVKTGASTTQGFLVGLSILSALGALHLLARRKSYSN